jgi:hypothetical protein
MATLDLTTSFPSKSTGSRKLYTGLFEPSSHNSIVTAVRTRTGTRLHNWHKIIEDGGNASTAMTAVWETTEGEPANAYVRTNNGGNKNEWCERRNGGDVSMHNVDFTRHHFASSISATFVDNLARTRFYGRLREVNTQFSGLVALGELRETAKMLRKPAAALWDSAERYIDALRKRKRVNPKGWIKDASGLWLEHSFGWLPLINDCKDAVKAYSRISEKPRSKIISAGMKKSYDRSRELDGSWEGNITRVNMQGGCCMYADARLYEHVAVRYKGKISARVVAPGWDNWALFGFTPREFLPAAWELLPWSFLVDYFTNVGDLITASCTSTSSVNFVNRTEIHFTDHQAKFLVDAEACRKNDWAGNAGKLEGFYGSLGSCRYTRRTVSRSPNSGIALPTFQASWDLSDGQLGNIAALLGQSRALHPQQVGKPYRFGGRP